MLHRNMQVRSFFCVVKKDFRRVSHSAKSVNFKSVKGKDSYLVSDLLSGRKPDFGGGGITQPLSRSGRLDHHIYL